MDNVVSLLLTSHNADAEQARTCCLAFVARNFMELFPRLQELPGDLNLLLARQACTELNTFLSAR